MAKKRKKKVAKVPTPKKHIHKHEPLASLKYFEVKEDGTIVHLRMQCPACGPGVYMSLHHQENQTRHHCGRCSTTIFSANEPKENAPNSTETKTPSQTEVVVENNSVLEIPS